MPRVAFEHIIPVFERTKSFHALDHAATVIGDGGIEYLKIIHKKFVL
jgi:hypothetical protein